MSQIGEGVLSKRTRRRGKWKQNWIRKNGGNLAKKQKLMDAVEDVKSIPAVVGLLSKPCVDKAVLTMQLKRKYSNPVHLWRKTYENLLKWQTTHQLNYWKNNSRNLYRENTKLKEEICTLRAHFDVEVVEPNKPTNDGDEVIDLEDDEETPFESSSEGENVQPTEDEKRSKFVQFLKATAAYNRKKSNFI